MCGGFFGRTQACSSRVAFRGSEGSSLTYGVHTQATGGQAGRQERSASVSAYMYNTEYIERSSSNCQERSASVQPQPSRLHTADHLSCYSVLRILTLPPPISAERGGHQRRQAEIRDGHTENRLGRVVTVSVYDSCCLWSACAAGLAGRAGAVSTVLPLSYSPIVAYVYLLRTRQLLPVECAYSRLGRAGAVSIAPPLSPITG